MGPLLSQRLGLLGIGIGLIIYAFQPDNLVKSQVNQPDIYLAIDSSASMMAHDLTPNRLTVAKHQATALSEMLSLYRIGLIQFAGDARIICPLTHDLASIQQRIASISPLYHWPGTRLSDAVLAAYRGFLNQSKTPILVIWSDGDSTSGDAYRMLFYAKQLNMRIISIGMGSLDGDPVPKQSGGFEKEGDQIILSKLNRDALVGIAEQTNGHYFEANQETDIPQAVYTHIMQLRGASTPPPTHPITPLPIIVVGLGLLLLPFIRSRPWLLALLILNSSVFATLPSHWHTHAAKTAWRNSQYKQAMQHTQTLMLASADPPQWLWYNHGKLHQAQGNQLTALSAFSHCDAVYDRALSLYLLGRFSAAMSILKPHIIQTPKDRAARVLFEHAYQNNATIQRYPPVASESVVYPDEGPLPLPFESWSAIRALDSEHYQRYHQLPTPSMRLEERSW